MLPNVHAARPGTSVPSRSHGVPVPENLSEIRLLYALMSFGSARGTRSTPGPFGEGRRREPGAENYLGNSWRTRKEREGNALSAGPCERCITPCTSPKAELLSRHWEHGNRIGTRAGATRSVENVEMRPLLKWTESFVLPSKTLLQKRSPSPSPGFGSQGACSP